MRLALSLLGVEHLFRVVCDPDHSLGQPRLQTLRHSPNFLPVRSRSQRDFHRNTISVPRVGPREGRGVSEDRNATWKGAGAVRDLRRPGWYCGDHPLVTLDML